MLSYITPLPEAILTLLARNKNSLLKLFYLSDKLTQYLMSLLLPKLICTFLKSSANALEKFLVDKVCKVK